MTNVQERPAPGRSDTERSPWARPEVVAAYEPSRAGWWSDPGEEVLFAAIAPRVRGRAVLDVGVGAGRTTGLLRLLTDDYVGVDVTAGMVDSCRRRYPDLDVRWADGRDLGVFDRRRFDVAMFSYNGLDCLDHAGRQEALAELARVLRPGGVLAFSTHNLDGPAFRPTPWRKAGPLDQPGLPHRVARTLANLVFDPGHLPRSWRNWYRLRTCGTEGDGWATSVVEGEDFGHVDHFTTLRRQVDELAEHGFAFEAAFDAERGARLHPGGHSRTPWFHVVAIRR